MTIVRWHHAALSSLLAVAAVSAQGCELRPSREFVPPTSMTSGPPVRAIATTAAESDAEPESPTPPPVEWVEGEREQVIERRLENGIPLYVVRRPELPAATVAVVFGTGTIPSPAPVPQIYADAAMIGRPLPWSRRQLDGARGFISANADFVAIGINALSPVLEGVLSNFLPAMVEAPLWAMDVDEAKADFIRHIARESEPDRRAFATAFGGLFPKPHPYGFAAAALVTERFREVKVADVRAFRDASLTTENMMVTATGDVDVDSLASTLSRALAKVPRTAIARAKVPAPEPSCTRKVIALDDAGSQQTTLSIAYPGVPANHADVAALEVLAAAAGGSLAARLNVSLRKGLGLSYGFAAELRTMREGGLFSVHGDVDPARTVEALRALDETLETLTRIPLGDDDLRIAKIRAAHSASRLRGVAAAVRIAASKILGVSLSDASKLKAVTSEEVRAAAEHYLQPAKRCIVAVGSAARIERELETAGLGPVSRAP